MLFLLSTRYLSRIHSRPLYFFRNSLDSSPMNCMVGIVRHIIMVNIEDTKIGCCPWSWIILFSEMNLSAHH
jgi:hypothetical protein